MVVIEGLHFLKALMAGLSLSELFHPIECPNATSLKASHFYRHGDVDQKAIKRRRHTSARIFQDKFLPQME
jgi:hypothetical protein